MKEVIIEAVRSDMAVSHRYTWSPDIQCPLYGANSSRSNLSSRSRARNRDKRNAIKGTRMTRVIRTINSNRATRGNRKTKGNKTTRENRTIRESRTTKQSRIVMITTRTTKEAQGATHPIKRRIKIGSKRTTARVLLSNLKKRSKTSKINRLNKAGKINKGMTKMTTTTAKMARKTLKLMSGVMKWLKATTPTIVR